MSDEVDLSSLHQLLLAEGRDEERRVGVDAVIRQFDEARVRWDRFFMRLAILCAGMSKDPSSRIGAVVSRPNKTVASMGWNGFARGVPDDPELYADRAYKLKTVVHAEINAILMAREPLQGYTLHVCGLPPCPACAGPIIQAGIARVVFEPRLIPARWVEDMRTSITMMLKAGVVVEAFDVESGDLFQAERQPKHARDGVLLRSIRDDEMVRVI